MMHQPNSTLRKFIQSPNDAMSNQCQQATYPVEHHILKSDLPFFHYNVTERQRLLKEPSEATWPQRDKTKPQRKVKAVVMQRGRTTLQRRVKAVVAVQHDAVLQVLKL
jgi:hypothetical protein